MNKEQKEFLETEFRSKASIIDEKRVEVVAPDGEVFTLLSQVRKYTSEETRQTNLRKYESIFDKYISEDKELMRNNIWREFMLNAAGVMGMSAGDRQGERTRIGKKIREIREEKKIEAKDLAKLANIDAANLSRIEQGRYSVGLDILSKIAAVLGYQVDIIPIQMEE